MVVLAWTAFYALLLVGTHLGIVYISVWYIAKRLRIIGWTVDLDLRWNCIVLLGTQAGEKDLWIRYSWWRRPKKSRW